MNTVGFVSCCLANHCRRSKKYRPPDAHEGSPLTAHIKRTAFAAGPFLC